MCGIAGLFCLDPGCGDPNHAVTVQAMCDVQTHRGPDDHGLESLDGVCLGSRRLSILDLSSAGHMPMRDATGRWWITYNGEVYNFSELRSDLMQLGHEFRSRTDTEVVLHAFMEWGDEALDRFVGMYAFAVFDREVRTLYLVRDRYGIKPLYYAQLDNHLLFASELKALAGALGAPRFDRRRLHEWFLYRNVDALNEGTLLEGISAVLPGRVLQAGPEGITQRDVYSLTDQVSAEQYRHFESMPPSRVVDEVDETLNEAVRQRLVSDVPVGTLLSGGLDSSLITVLSAQHQHDFKAFNVSITGHPDLDEKRYAVEVADRLDIPLVSYELGGPAFRQALPHVVYLSDMPLSHPNTVAYYLISQIAREHGVIVLLSGEGADELFGGYAWNYRRAQRLVRMAPLLDRIPEKVWSLLALFTYAHYGMPVTSIAFRDLLPPTIALIDRWDREDLQRRCEEAYGFVGKRSERVVLSRQLADLTDFLSPLLRRLDRATMGASVEARVPFLDHRLVHLAIHLPAPYRVGRRSDKWLLKRVAERYLPRGIVRRKKAGFPLPLGDYLAPIATPDFFRDGFCQEELALNRRGLAAFLEAWPRWPLALFGLITLEIWGRLYVAGQSTADVESHIATFEPPSP